MKLWMFCATIPGECTKSTCLLTKLHESCCIAADCVELKFLRFTGRAPESCEAIPLRKRVLRIHFEAHTPIEHRCLVD